MSDRIVLEFHGTGQKAQKSARRKVQCHVVSTAWVRQGLQYRCCVAVCTCFKPLGVLCCDVLCWVQGTKTLPYCAAWRERCGLLERQLMGYLNYIDAC